MTVRSSLLAILDQGPCYGYQLRQDFLRRTGSVWPLNVGQVYSTLDRLERDGLVVRSGLDAEGHVLYQTSAAGSAAAREWLSSSVPRDDRNELAIKVALAASLPGIGASGVIEAQRALAAAPASDNPVVEAWRVAAAEAEDRWLDVCEALRVQPYGVETEAPKRGRPARMPQ